MSQPATAELTGPVLQASALTKVYGSPPNEVVALDAVDVMFTRGTFTAIMGPSGSGKSTLMHCLAGLDRPTSGTITLGRGEITSLDDKALTSIRRDRIGFVFQSFNLLPMLTARQNILLPLDLAGRVPNPEWFDHVTTSLGLEDRLEHRPSELSGGQQQRVAVARALIARPEVIFADEPTGSLDSRSSVNLLTYLRRSVDELYQTVIMVTHDARAAAFADRVLLLFDGRIVAELPDPTIESVTAASSAWEA